MSQYLYVDLESRRVLSSINASHSRCGQKEILSSGRLGQRLSFCSGLTECRLGKGCCFFFAKITASIGRYLDRTMHRPRGRICLKRNCRHLGSHSTSAKYVWNNEFSQPSLVFTNQLCDSVCTSVMLGIKHRI